MGLGLGLALGLAALLAAAHLGARHVGLGREVAAAVGTSFLGHAGHLQERNLPLVVAGGHGRGISSREENLA
jgi:hypothetical protein